MLKNPRPAELTHELHAMIPATMNERLEEVARSAKLTKTQLVIEALEALLEKYESK